MGARFRLKAAFDDSAYPRSARVIIAAMKKYGLILADIGADFFFGGATDGRWLDEELNTLKQLRATDFEMVELGAVITSYAGTAAPGAPTLVAAPQVFCNLTTTAAAASTTATTTTAATTAATSAATSASTSAASATSTFVSPSTSATTTTTSAVSSATPSSATTSTTTATSPASIAAKIRVRLTVILRSRALATNCAGSSALLNALALDAARTLRTNLVAPVINVSAAAATATDVTLVVDLDAESAAQVDAAFAPFGRSGLWLNVTEATLLADFGSPTPIQTVSWSAAALADGGAGVGVSSTPDAGNASSSSSSCDAKCAGIAAGCVIGVVVVVGISVGAVVWRRRSQASRDAARFRSQSDTTLTFMMQPMLTQQQHLFAAQIPQSPGFQFDPWSLDRGNSREEASRFLL
jgi:hypothetical protein